MADFPAYPANDTGLDNFKTSIGFTPSTWPVNAKLTMCHVPWDEGYRDIVYFASTTARDNYFSGISSTEKIVMSNATYCRPNEPVRVNVPYSQAYTYNYLVVENPALPVPGEVTPPKLFYFIIGVSMIAPNTTGLYLQLDAWMTYQHTVTIGRAFVERGHVARHAYRNSNDGTSQDRRRRYLTAPEGLDVGNSYIIVNETEYDMVGANSPWIAIIVTAADLRIASGQTLTQKFGTINAPLLPVALGMKIDGFVSACDVYAIQLDSTDFTAFIGALNGYPWISNQILSITAMPEKFCDVWSPVTTDRLPGGILPYNPKSQYNVPDASTVTMNNMNMFIREYDSTGWGDYEKSCLWPFSYLMMTNECSQPVLLKPELFPDNSISFSYFASVVPPFQRIAVLPVSYGSYDNSVNGQTNQMTMDGNTVYQSPHWGDRFSSALIWQEFPQLSILNDGYINYLASNARSLAFARDNQGWILDKSLAGTQVSYDNAMRNMGAAAQNQQLAYQTQRDISRYSMGNLVSNQLRDTYNRLSEGAQGGISGIFGADVGTIINTTVNAATGATANEVGNMQFQTTQQAQQGNIDANYQLQQWAAKGDYEQAIAGIDATVQDAQLTPPNQSGTVGGGWPAVLASKGLFMWWLKAYTLEPGARHRIMNFWHRFGYAVNEYVGIGNSFSLMSKFTYWKLQDTTLDTTVHIDEGAKSIIRGIFEKGVTVWENPADIGEDILTLNNTVKTGQSPLY